MTKIKKLLSIVLTLFLFFSSSIVLAKESDEKEWQRVYDAREAFYTKNFGKFPDDIMKAANLLGDWPGGGFYVIPANKLGKGLWLYTTFGLSNADMPATMQSSNVNVKHDDQGNVTESSFKLEKKKNVASSSDKAGYGYEVIMVAKENAQWPLWFMQWAANIVFINNVDLLYRVERNNGLTVEAVPVGNHGETINVLIAKAQKPLPTGINLPNGNMQFLVATVITDQEMQWSMKNGRDALLKKLMDSGVGQISDRNRSSIIK